MLQYQHPCHVHLPEIKTKHMKCLTEKLNEYIGPPQEEKINHLQFTIQAFGFYTSPPTIPSSQ